MIEVKDATSIIEHYKKIYKRKVYRLPFTILDEKEVALLMIKYRKTFISLPYISQGIVETKPKSFDPIPFPSKWQIRDVVPHSQYVYSDKVNFEINLREEYKYSSNTIRKIRKAKQNGIIIKYESGISLINDFYKVYTKRMHQIGVPPISKKLIKANLKTNHTILFVAYKDNKPIGGSTLDKISDTYFENTLFATLSSHNKYYTSYLLHDTMINYSLHNDAKTYSFGRSTKDSSVYYFKKHFKAKEIPLYWSFSHKTNTLRNKKWLFSLWKRLPYKLTILFGGIIYRRIY